MKPFEENPTCPKCGGAEVVKRHLTMSSNMPEEHLACCCQTCRYNWSIRCKDYVETDADADIQEQLDNTGALR